MLLSLPNRKYETVLEQHQHLRNKLMNDLDKKTELRVHLIFCASDYTEIKVQETSRIRQLGEPMAELTCLGWALMSLGK